MVGVEVSIESCTRVGAANVFDSALVATDAGRVLAEPVLAVRLVESTCKPRCPVGCWSDKTVNDTCEGDVEGNEKGAGVLNQVGIISCGNSFPWLACSKAVANA